MRGSGHHSSGGKRSLGAKIKAEVDSALRLLFKDVSQRSISTELTGNLIGYQMVIDCETVGVPLKSAEIDVSEDPIAALKQTCTTQSGALVPSEASLSDNLPCTIAPALCHEPVLGELQPEWASIHFENVSFANSRFWAVEPVATQALSQSPEAFGKPLSKPLNPSGFSVSSYSLMDNMPSFRIMNDPRLYALPIKKAPIPPSRFPSATRTAFRKALSEKGGTHPNNVQLRVVYERMDMTLFAAIQQDQQGNLLCTPKNELIGRNQSRNKRLVTSSMYLVYGFRLDNKEELRALVPVADVNAGKP